MSFLLRCFFYLPICFVCPQWAFTQTHAIDSLENLLKQAPTDSERVLNFALLANSYYNFDTLRGWQYLNSGYVLVKKLKWDYATAFYYQNKGDIEISAGHFPEANSLFDTAIIYYQKSIAATRNAKELSDAQISIATCNGQKADILLSAGKSKEAINAYIIALEIWKSSNNPQKLLVMGTYYSNISTVYYNLGQYEKALEYEKLTYTYRKMVTSEEGMAYSLIYLSDDFSRLNQLDSALIYLTKARPLVEKLNSHRITIQYYNQLGRVSRMQNDFKTAIGYYERALEEAKSANNLFSILTAQELLGICYEKLKDYIKARHYLEPALASAVQTNRVTEIQSILKELVIVEENTNNKEKAFDYLKQLTAVQDSVNAQASKKAIAEIENKYQAAEKEKKIIKLQKDKEIQTLSLRQTATFNYLLMGTVAALLIIGILGYRNFRHRHLLVKKEAELRQQRVSEVEKDRQLVVTDAVLKGQEEERSRLAKDLHDGLGGLLSGVKFSLSNMKDNLIVTPDNMNVFERSLDMIDTAIRELRRVAHNMMPEMLTKFGLDEAVKEYCNNINSTKLISIKYQSVGMQERLENSVEIIIYRIIQELLNNILKHAAATEAFVQIVRAENRLNVVIEDNGKGFDSSLPENNGGAGLANIRSRVAYLKGQFAIHARPGNGTLANMEFNV